MKLAYIDYSGDPDPELPGCYVISAVLVDGSDWHRMEGEVDAIKGKHFPGRDAHEIEFHVHDMLRRKGNYRHMFLDRTIPIWDDIFKMAGDPATPILLIATAIRKERVRHNIDLVKWGYGFLFERIEYYMQGILRETGADDQALLILDNEKFMMNDDLLDTLLPLLRNGTRYSKFSHIIRPPLFSDSKKNNMIQVSDSVAYAIQKRYGANDGKYAKIWLDYFDRLGPNFYSRDGQYEGIGLKVFP
ncbi:MAG: DUF3800 domain-containing protein [Alphaproteobacteria bacterium]|nr:DUF3800 domain-containing protein [Alphaproteobacteria bacterium]